MTLIPTPTSPTRSNTEIRSSTQCPPLPLDTLLPLPVTTLSATSWRTAYPQIGQFAMTESEEVVAAGPDGLFYFKRVQDHASRPWTEPRPLPNTMAMLNDSSVSGLAIHVSELLREASAKPRLDVYCVSGGVLHNFCRSGEPGSWFVANPRPPLPDYVVNGTPSIVTAYDSYRGLRKCSLVVPCLSGGLLHTSGTSPSASSLRSSKNPEASEALEWEPADLIATELGFISAVSIAATRTRGAGFADKDIVAVCIAGARLHTVEGRLMEEPGCQSRSVKWKPQKPTKIHHPGEVIGNPVLLKTRSSANLDLLVPSAEGGVFHFIRTSSTPDEWRMIARVAFPQNLPPVSCLALVHFRSYCHQEDKFSAVVQSSGRLYQMKTDEGANPWSGSRLKPIMAPGPAPSD
ncbi:hypothetical protein F4825DRAFT_408495 [Nemania diffusa]|nr:hypothetical protein F4825DRAFT_408495 [Nemania diffusa]